MHHAYSDTEKDPHTPHFFKEVFTMMMHTKNVYNGVLHGTLEIENRFDKNFPVYPIIKLFNKIGIIKLIPLKY